MVGGVYHKKSPFFHNAVTVDFIKCSKPFINYESLKQILDAKYLNDDKEFKIGELTSIGIQKGEFGDNLGIEKSPFEVLDEIKEEVKKAFNE